MPARSEPAGIGSSPALPILSFPSLRWLATLVALTAVTHVDGLFGPLHSDASAWLYISQQRDRGLLPYRDLWENKPPAIFFLYRAAWKSGWVREFLYTYDVVMTAAGAWALCRVSARFLRAGPAMLASALFVLATSHPTLHYGGGITEASALPWVVIGLSLAIAYRLNGGVWRAMACGVAWACAIAFRMPAVISLGGVLPWLLARAPNPQGGSRVGLIGGASCGGVAGALIMLLDPLWGGYVSEFIDVCVLWNLKYAAHDVPSITVGWSSAIPLFFQNLSYWAGLHALAIGGFVLSITKWRGLTPRIFLVTGVLWYAADLLSTFPTLHQYPHHHYMTLGSLALNAAVCIEHLLGYGRRWFAHGVAAITVAYCATVWAIQVLPKFSESRERQAVLDAADFLRTSTAADEPVLLWVWHDEAELFWRVNRPPAARHFMPAAAFVYDPGIAIATCEQMLRSPPRFIADSQPYLPLLDNPAPTEPLTRYQRIQRRYYAQYRPVAQFGRITIYQRRD